MDSFESIRRLATTLGVSCPESSDNVFDGAFINSLNRAAKRLQNNLIVELEEARKVSEWISVEDGLPEGGQTVIAMDEFDARCSPYVPVDGLQGAIYFEGDFYMDDPTVDHPCKLSTVSHWMPIPKAPVH